tara:strand:- start:2115 stop:3779 length:1665 start_codon:yes stop_codon:yes gene_type:complete
MVQRQRVRSKAGRFGKSRKHLPQGIATVLTASIIAIIILAPSALAISVEIQGLSNGQLLGNSGSFSFLAKITISSGEVIPLDRLNIVLDSVIFQFNPSTGATIGSTSSVISSVSPVNFVSGALYSTVFNSGYGYSYASTPLKAYSYGYGSNYYGSPYEYGYGFSGPRTFIWNVTLLPENLSVGDHTIRMDVITAGLSMNTYSSSTITFEVVSGASASGAIPVTATSATIDHTVTTKTKVVLTGITLTDPTIPATITTLGFDTAPTTSVTVAAGTGKTPAKFVDVKGFNFASGTAAITITYTDAVVSGLDESTLTLYYWSSSLSTWVQFSSIVINTAANTVTGSIDVTLLEGTYVALAGSAPTAAAPPVPIAGPEAGLPGVSATLNTNLRLVSLEVAPGSTVTVSIILTSTQLMSTGSITLTLPENLIYSDLTTSDFDGSNTLTGRTLVLERDGAVGSNTARIFFKLTAPLDSTIKVGETYTVTIDEIIMQGMAINFQSEQTVTLNIVQPTISNIYSALDSHFNGVSSPYTENRYPTVNDIMNLLDFRLAGEVSP